MRTWFVLVLLAGGLAGCHKVSVSDLKKLKTEACACADDKCGKAAEHKLEDLLGDASEDELGKEGVSLSFDIMICAKKVQSGLSND